MKFIKRTSTLQSISTLILLSIYIQPVMATPAFSTSSPWMLGDWNGQRTDLQQQGYDFTFGYTGESASLLDGGYRDNQETRYADQFALGTHINLQKILGWQDTEAQITITERNGHNLSTAGAGDIGDPRVGQLSSVQEVWGRGQTWRLTDFWVKKKFLDQKLDIKVGRFGEGEDFNSFDCDFQNLSLCGSQVGNWVGDIWYNWPVSQWAARAKYNFEPSLAAQVGVYEYNPENLERGKGFNLSTDGSHGAIIPLELIWQPVVGSTKLPGEYRLGYYYSTADSTEVKHPNYTDHKQGGWLVIKQKLLQHPNDPNRGLSGFVNLTVHDKKTNVIDQFQNIGLVYTGIVDSRPKDDIGIGVARIHVSKDVSSLQQLNNSSLLPIDVNYQPVQHSEINAELYYGIHATNWLTIRPNLQYIHQPGGVKGIDDAWIGGLKVQTSF